MKILHNRFIRISTVLITAFILTKAGFLLKSYKGIEPLSKWKGTLSILVSSKEYPAETKLRQTLPKGAFRITYVIDGDTLVLSNREKIRLIGVDAPEIQHDDIPGEWYGKEAKEFLKQLAEGKECTLGYETDGIRDRYGRILAYVFMGNKLLNAEMIRQGYARVYMRFSFTKKTEFIRLEKEARGKGIGIWSRQLFKKNKKAGTPAVIQWQDADKHYGEYCAVEGKIVSTYNSGKACFLNFHKDYNHYLTAVIFSSDFDKFPLHPENYYYGKKIRVSGKIQKYKGKPEIVLEEQRSIEVLK